VIVVLEVASANDLLAEDSLVEVLRDGIEAALREVLSPDARVSVKEVRLNGGQGDAAEDTS